jgi:hypothetical protein
MINELREVAYHEAAHAVVAKHFGFWVSSIDIVGDEESEGLSVIEVPCFDPCDDGKKYIPTIFNDAVVDLAGHAATAKFLKEPDVFVVAGCRCTFQSGLWRSR